MPNLNVPGTTIPGEFSPGSADPGSPGLQNNYDTLGTDQTVFGTKTFTQDTTFLQGAVFDAQVIIADASSPGLIISEDGTYFNPGAIVFRQDQVGHPGGAWFGIYDPANSLFYGISQKLPSPPSAATVAGYFNGLGIGGASNNTGQAIFGILNNAQSGKGKNQVTLTAYDNNEIVTFNSTLDDGSGNMALFGGLSTSIRTVITSLTLGATDSTVLVNAASVTVTLPTAVGITGRLYTVKMTAASGTVTVATTASQTIDGTSTHSLSSNAAITVQSDGSNWFIVSSH